MLATAERHEFELPVLQHEDIDIEKIVIGERYRKDLGDIAGLAASIKEQGLLQPVGVDRDNNLVFGERRLRAFQRLGWSRISVRRVNVTSIVEGEYAENDVRKDFTPSERVAIMAVITPPAGGDRKSDQKQNFAFDRDDAAKKAGFNNYETARQARSVVANGAPELVQAMDAGKVSISAASTISRQDAEIQRRIVAEDNMARKAAELRSAEADLARLKSMPRLQPKRPEDLAREKEIFGTIDDRQVLARIDEAVRVMSEQPPAAEAIGRIPSSLHHTINLKEIRRAAAWLTDFASAWEHNHVA